MLNNYRFSPPLILIPSVILLAILGFGCKETSTSASGSDTSQPVLLEGSGTEQNPFKISTVGDLDSLQKIEQFTRDSMRTYLTGHYVLTADINARPTADWNGGLGFNPIGKRKKTAQEFQYYRFLGHLDGQGHTISHLTMSRTVDEDQDYAFGLFSSIGGGSVTNLTLEDVNYRVGAVSSDIDYLRVGGLTGILENASVKNVTVTGTITATHAFSVGGIAGTNGASIRESEADITMETSALSSGGIAGRLIKNAEIVNSIAEGSIDGTNQVGGIAGRIDSAGHVRLSSASMEVNGSNQVGGIAGENLGLIEQSHAGGSVKGKRSVGGLVGVLGRTLRQSYSDGELVSGNDRIGGLVGSARLGTIHNSYSHTDVKGKQNIGGAIGANEFSKVKVNNVYATGEVQGEETLAGFVALTFSYNDLYHGAYWDTESTGQNEGTQSVDDQPYNLIGLSTEQMIGDSAKVHMDSFDFSSTWNTTDQYPQLHWE